MLRKKRKGRGLTLAGEGSSKSELCLHKKKRQQKREDRQGQNDGTNLSWLKKKAPLWTKRHKAEKKKEKMRYWPRFKRQQQGGKIQTWKSNNFATKGKDTQDPRGRLQNSVAEPNEKENDGEFELKRVFFYKKPKN